MAGSKSDYLETKVIQHLFESDFSAPANMYVALYTVAPTDAGGGTECSGGAYARVGVARGTGWTSAGDATENAADITFTEATASWGTVVAFGLFDASTVGNLLYWGDLTASKTIDNGDTAKIPAGDLDITEG
jgi:hypothetical protein